MPFSVYFGWGLLAPAGFILLYGITSYRVKVALGYMQKGVNTVRYQVHSVLLSLFLYTLWGMVDIPLPILYILDYGNRLYHVFRRSDRRKRVVFLINLSHLMAMALHMILIGAASLVTGMQMFELLAHPLWRIVTISIVLAVNNLLAWQMPRWGMMLEVLRTQSESEEVRPFMLFLWVCNVFLFLDSALCILRIDWKLLPVFLIGSTVLLEFYLLGFLRHLYQVLKVNYLEEEHHRLAEELEKQNQYAEELRSKSMIDTMTGIFSRQYLEEQAEQFFCNKKQFSFVFIDLDHLKQVNDREGHHAGDLYLIHFVREFSSYLRDSDIFARVGGDEFIVLLPDCPLDTAQTRMEDIRQCMEEKCPAPIPFSYGIASAESGSKENLEQIFKIADQAMYLDKQSRSGKRGDRIRCI